VSRQVVRTKKFVEDAAAFIRREARMALGERQEFRIALSGGNTPRPVYAELARPGGELPWERILFTFGDERCVPPTDEQSNFRMANESLFEPGAVPEGSIMRMRGEADPALAAQEYEDQLNLLARQRGETIYRHDLILLGLGPDGHMASLFPGTAALAEKMRWVVANFVPKMNAWRLTFTLPLILQARRVCFLVNANKQAELIARVWDGDDELPAVLVDGKHENVTWILGE
jgi:6-phosphogluconolactonase